MFYARFSKVIILFLLIILCSATLWMLIEQVRVERIIRKSDRPKGYLEALAQDPKESYAMILGDYWANQAIPPDPERAEAAYRMAVELNPWHAAGWQAWAKACGQLGKRQEAEKAFTIAADQLAPNYRNAQLEAGNYYLKQGELEQAARHHVRAIALSPPFARSLYTTYWSLGEPPLKVADALLGRTPELLRTYFTDCLGWVEPEVAGELWQSFGARAGVFNAQTYQQYFSYLLTKKAYAQARDLWGQAAREFYQREWQEKEELFWNGDLRLPLNFKGGLEWQITQPLPDGIEAGIITARTLEATKMLQIRFGGRANVQFQHVRHLFFVEPGMTYRLRFNVNHIELTTENGPYLRLAVHSEPALTVKSRVYTGTGHLEETMEFTVPPTGHWAELQLCRDLSKKLNNKIKGLIAFSKFTLTEAPGQDQEAAR